MSALPMRAAVVRCTFILHLLVPSVLLASLCPVNVTVAADPSPELDTAPRANHAIRVLIGPTAPIPRQVRGKAGKKAGVPTGPLNTPFAMDFDPEGRMVIVEYEGGRVLRMDPDAENPEITLEVLAGPRKHDADDAIGGTDGNASSARFNKLHNVVVDADGTMYFSDHLNHRIRRLKNGRVHTFAGSEKSGSAVQVTSRADARFNRPIFLSLDSPNQRLLLADINNRSIRAISLREDSVTTLAGNGKRGVPKDGAVAKNSPLFDPRAVYATAGGSIYVLERGGHALRRIDADGRIQTVAGDGVAGLRDGIGTASRMDGPKFLSACGDG
ncbi:MAG: hypothetical protein AAFN70_09530, partial [Planctomycetota bacterium]